MAKVLFFTGAPEAKALRKDTNVLLSDDLEDAIARYTGRNPVTSVEISNDGPYWRSVPFERRHLPSGISQNGKQDDHGGAHFLSTTQIDTFIDDASSTQIEHISSVQSVEELLSQFYEQSYGIHQDIASSQLQQISQTESSRDSFGSSSFPYTESFDAEASFPKSPLPRCHLTKLKEIPSARYISAINPQTLTVNILIGVISVLEPRHIRTRSGADVQLVEMIAGDETRSGFTINFWLSSTSEECSRLVEELRSQDIILIENVALSSFRSRVYGQSLRKNVTRVHLLFRKSYIRKHEIGHFSATDLLNTAEAVPCLQRTTEVWHWVERFVFAPDQERIADSRKQTTEILPPDTPPSCT